MFKVLPVDLRLFGISKYECEFSIILSYNYDSCYFSWTPRTILEVQTNQKELHSKYDLIVKL